MSIGSNTFYIDLLICLDAISLYVSLGVSTLKETICPKFSWKTTAQESVKSAIAVVVFAKRSLS